MPPAKRSSPRDHTGRKREELQAQHAEEQQRRENEIGMATAAAQQERDDSVVDLTGSGPVRLNDHEAIAAADMRARDSMHLPLGATKQPGQAGVTTDASGKMVDTGQTGWPGAKTNDTGTSALANPAAPTVTTATTGGALPATTAHAYKVTATNVTGESAASASGAVTTGAGATNKNTVSWSPVVGAEGYKVYGRTGGTFGLLATVDASTLSWVDTGTPAPGAAAPGANTTGTLPTGTESPFPVMGGTVADQKVRPTVDTLNASRVGVPGGGPDPEAPRVWLLGNPSAPTDPEEPIRMEPQPVHQMVGPVQTMERTGSRVIRLNTTLEQVTIGAGTSYDFIEGQRYKVPEHVADYLEELGYVYH